MQFLDEVVEKWKREMEQWSVVKMEWSNGMEQWNGTMEWNNGMEQ